MLRVPGNYFSVLYDLEMEDVCEDVDCDSIKEWNWKDQIEEVSLPCKKGRRVRIHWSSNFTPARYRDSHDDCMRDLLDGSAESLRLLERIADDAFRRMQLLHFQFEAYRNSGLKVFREKTLLQHGWSSCQDCAGAHSCLLPSLGDDLSERLKKVWDTSLIDTLECMGVPREVCEDESRKKEVLQFLDETGGRKLVTDATHLLHMMNITMELPKYVNDVHGVLEAIFREKAIVWIQEVSDGKATPHKGVEKACVAFGDFLSWALVETQGKLKGCERLEGLFRELEQKETALKGCTRLDQAEYEKLCSLLDQIHLVGKILCNLRGKSLPLPRKKTVFRVGWEKQQLDRVMKGGEDLSKVLPEFLKATKFSQNYLAKRKRELKNSLVVLDILKIHARMPSVLRSVKREELLRRRYHVHYSKKKTFPW